MYSPTVLSRLWDNSRDSKESQNKSFPLATTRRRDDETTRRSLLTVYHHPTTKIATSFLPHSYSSVAVIYPRSISGGRSERVEQFNLDWPNPGESLVTSAIPSLLRTDAPVALNFIRMITCRSFFCLFATLASLVPSVFEFIYYSVTAFQCHSTVMVQ